jgi:protein SCO1/2
MTTPISADAVAASIDNLKPTHEGRAQLASMLPLSQPLYAGRGADEVARLRGYILSSAERVGLLDSALPHALEELQSGHRPYLVAAAARAIRGLTDRNPSVLPYLTQAIRNLRDEDDIVSFEAYRPARPLREPTTGATEVFTTLGWLGLAAAPALPVLEELAKTATYTATAQAALTRAVLQIQLAQASADCCCDEMSGSGAPAGSCCEADAEARPSPDVFWEDDVAALTRGVILEDQNGASLPYGTVFEGKPSVVAFFYTRCDNPYKCSRTISELAELQTMAAQRGLAEKLRTAAITYDPDYDRPPRLLAYGANRGVKFSEDNRIFRATAGYQELRQRFSLEVNFNGASVNGHSIELFVLDSTGAVASAFTQLQWSAAEVLAAVESLIDHEGV